MTSEYLSKPISSVSSNGDYSLRNVVFNDLGFEELLVWKRLSGSSTTNLRFSVLEELSWPLSGLDQRE